MKILNKKLVEEAANSINPFMDVKTARIYKDNFKAGVEWAESQMEELAIEFAMFAMTLPLTISGIIYNDKAYNGDLKELFQQFLKERK